MAEDVVLRSHPTGPSIAVSVSLIVVGVLAIVAPFFAGVAVSIFLGWLILFGGLAHLVYAWSERGVGAVLWQVLIALVYFVAAYYLLARPISGVVTLTLILAFYIAMQGVIELVTWMQLRRRHGAAWFLINGLVSLLVAALIFAHWPSSAAWALGTLVGISVLMSGIARLTLPTRRRRALLVA